MRKPHRDRLLVTLFLLATFMGAGPGLHLVNPDPGSGGPAPTILGLPIVYAWGVAWFLVEVAVIVVAFRSFGGREAGER